mmetsp:Transcript_117213/g.207444  ORF Transcript_117213/g.207444 Transcript_117213/m.207444 type:complete len:143 (+) Transcript_117213:626-1054(+)
MTAAVNRQQGPCHRRPHSPRRSQAREMEVVCVLWVLGRQSSPHASYVPDSEVMPFVLLATCWLDVLRKMQLRKLHVTCRVAQVAGAVAMGMCGRLAMVPKGASNVEPPVAAYLAWLKVQVVNASTAPEQPQSVERKRWQLLV